MSNKRTWDIGFFSSADRGLDTLCAMIPEIEKRLGRKVTSCWAYGWNVYDKFHATNPDKMKWKWQIIKAMNEVGMESKGRLSHEELADLMRDTKVWAYPTNFNEIHCITALKAQAAGCVPVTSGFAALQETVYIDEEEVEDMAVNKEAQSKFIDRVVEALKNQPTDKELKDRAEKVLSETTWDVVAKVWDKALCE